MRGVPTPSYEARFGALAWRARPALPWQNEEEFDALPRQILASACMAHRLHRGPGVGRLRRRQRQRRRGPVRWCRGRGRGRGEHGVRARRGHGLLQRPRRNRRGRALRSGRERTCLPDGSGFGACEGTDHADCGVLPDSRGRRLRRPNGRRRCRCMRVQPRRRGQLLHRRSGDGRGWPLRARPCGLWRRRHHLRRLRRRGSPGDGGLRTVRRRGLRWDSM